MLKASSRGEVFMYPVEDIGILYSGNVVNSLNNTPVHGIEVVLSIKDTLPEVQSGITDSEGQFVFLIDKYTSKKAYIDLYKDGNRLTGSFKIRIDKKFFYDKSTKESYSLVQSSGTDFTGAIEDEAQRVIIQRAFGNQNLDRIDSLTTLPYAKGSFYGEPLLVVYPGEYFFLPNFVEIAREIVPRVKYKTGKTGCEFIVTHVENNTRSNKPLVLLDGEPVINLCDIQLLNSDHIHRIEVQSGMRVVGNYLYDGLVAIYTTPMYKSKLDNKNDRLIFDVPGFSLNPSFGDVFPIVKYNKHSISPDFKNQLYWNSNVTIKNGEEVEIEFITTDEESEYILEIDGFADDGMLIHFQKVFTVNQ